MDPVALGINHFAFRQVGSEYLVTNDTGRCLFVGREVVEGLANGNRPNDPDTRRALEEHFFVIPSQESFCAASEAVRKHKSYLFNATELHIMILTRRCNHACVYCQASASGQSEDPTALSMSSETARLAVDFAMASSAPHISIEFQGGEPLLAFDRLREIVLMAERRAFEVGKEVEFSVVSNLVLLDNQKLDFLVSHRVGINTSLDGPEALHNANRACARFNSHQSVLTAIDTIRRRDETTVAAVQALMTTTRASLDRAGEIIDEYVDLELGSIFIRPLTPLGQSRRNWDRIGYDPSDFVEFYRDCVTRIAELNRSRMKLREIHTELLLKKILGDDQPNYMELRSPCGGALGQLAYDWDGSVYTCDVGRMLAASGDDSFKVGDVSSGRPPLEDNATTKSVCAASCLESIPGCSDCAYSPYCGTCPVVNLAEGESIFPKPGNYRCRIMQGMLDVLFAMLRSGSIPSSMLDWDSGIAAARARMLRCSDRPDDSPLGPRQ